MKWSLKSPSWVRVGDLVWFPYSDHQELGFITASHGHQYQILPLDNSIQMQTRDENGPRPFYSQKLEKEARDDTIVKVRKIESFYSLLAPVHQDREMGSITYYGCFLGAERIEVGDYLRARIDHEETILGVLSVRTFISRPGEIYFSGVVYRRAGVTDRGPLVSRENLPNALQDDVYSYIELGNATLGARRILGRIYPPQKSGPVPQASEPHPQRQGRNRRRYQVNRCTLLAELQLPLDTDLQWEVPTVREEKTPSLTYSTGEASYVQYYH